MSEIHISNEGVIKMMKVLNPSKALGPDDLHPRVLKELAVELGPVFAHLFQQSLDKGEIPKEWSLANICPLYKKGERALSKKVREKSKPQPFPGTKRKRKPTNPNKHKSNNRPVSLTCVPCKML